MDDEFFAELVETFILEFEELMGLYASALKTLRKRGGLNDAKKQAYADLFRIYHTLKGDSGYFPDFANFTSFATAYCERLRPLDDSVYTDDQLREEIRLNYSRLSSVLMALQKGRSLKSFSFNQFQPAELQDIEETQ